MAVNVEQDQDQTNYQNEIKAEIGQLDPADFSHASRLLGEELKKSESGNVEPPKDKLLEVHHERPQKILAKVRIPLPEFPRFNFVGKLLGPKGNSLKRLQEETGTKMSILGRGSMRDKAKEEQLRKEGGKYSHLNEDLHVLIEAFSEITDSYARISHALGELKKYMSPEYNDEIHDQQMQELMYLNGEKPAAPPGRGRGRGAPGQAGGRGGILSSPAGRGGPSGRGGPLSRGGFGAPRGASRGAGMGLSRGARAPHPPPQSAAVEPAYDEYGAGYDEGYGQEGGGYGRDSYETGDTQYFDYGHGSQSQSYDDGFGDQSWGGSSAPMKAPPTRGRGQYRAHPYSSGRGGGGY